VAVEAASFRDLHDIPALGALHRPRRRAVHGEGAVTTPRVVVLEIVAEEPAEVALAEDNDVVEALAADAADHSLGERVLPGVPRSGEDFLDAHTLHPPPEGWPVHVVAISNQVTRSRLPVKRLGDLLRSPLRCRMLGNVAVHDPAPGVGENDEDEEDLERDRGHDEEVDGHESFTWLLRKARHVGYGGFLGRAMYFSAVAFAT